MELRHLRYFAAVAETLHFGRAARRLHLTQPALSQQIRQLEAELGTPLLDRGRQRVELTEAGRLFLDEARDILARANRAANAVRRASSRGQRIRLGTGYVMDQSLVVSAIQSFSHGLDDARVEVFTMAVRRQIEALRDGRLDVALVRSTPDDAGLETAELVREPLVVALPRRHRLATRERIELRELADERFVLVPRQAVPVYHELVVSVCRRAGFVPDAAQEADHLRLILMMVAGGSGVSIVPACARAAGVPDLVLRPITTSDAAVATAIAWRTDAPPVVREFVNAMRATAARRAA